MDNLRRVLMWEMIGYYPEIFFILQSTSVKLMNSIKSDLDYIYYFLESTFGIEGIRGATYEKCYFTILKVTENPGGVISLERCPKIISYDLTSEKQQIFDFDFLGRIE